MPLVAFDSLPDTARVWVFGSARALDGREEATLLERVDRYLAQWRAHGAPLTVGRTWTEHRFLCIAVDTRDAAASGCSIDALYGELQAVERTLGVALVGGGRLYWRDPDGTVCSAERGAFDAGGAGVGSDTPVFDPTVTVLGAWRERFELPARSSWHAALILAER